MRRFAIILSALVLAPACSDDSEGSGSVGAGGSAMMGGGMAGDAMTGSSGSGMAGSTASGDNITGDNTQTDFATKVHPIFLSKCLPCHSFEHGNADLDAAYAFTQMRLGGADSLAVYDDILLRTMATDGSIMPPSDACVTFNEGGCLTQTEWDTINDWVEAGAQR